MIKHLSTSCLILLAICSKDRSIIALDETIAQKPLVIGADGVMIPMRPHKPNGKTKWREVKVGRIQALGEYKK